MKKILIAGTNSGVGKTTISMGIMKALSKRGLKVQPYKVGPDYIDTSYHEFVTNQKSRNLDTYMLDKEVVKYLFNKNSKYADISVIEGVMGLYDGYGVDIDACTSSYMSKLLKTPVILVIDGKSMATSSAAMVLGYKSLDTNVKIEGVIINNISSPSHYEMIKSAIEKYTNTKVLGYLPKNIDFSMPSRHLGLIPTLEMNELEEKFELLSKTIEEYIDLDAILDISESEDVKSNFVLDIEKFENVNLAVAYDKSFNFYYWDNLDLLKELGVNIKLFSPLYDEKLPDCDAIYIGGGFPEVFGEELEKNHSIRYEIKKAHENNIPIYAECGGLMYLGTKLEDLDEGEYNMVGILDGKSVMTKSLKRFGYCMGIANVNTVISNKGEKVLGHEFHHSEFITDEMCAYNMMKIREGNLIKEWTGGYQKQNTLGTYLHTHFYSNLNMLKNFLQKVADK